MSAFAESCGTEEKGMRVLIPFIRKSAANGQFVVTNKGRISEFLQKSVGDVLVNEKSGDVSGIEIKTEERFTGNLFLEVWSNRRRETPGWMHTLNTDYLFYYFLDVGQLFICRFGRLCNWAFSGSGGATNIEKFPLREQAKQKQANDTWGRCVPIRTLERVVSMKKYDLGVG